MEGLIGKKIGMTQVFTDDGKRVCVTVIEVGPCPVVQVKTLEKDGYLLRVTILEEETDSGILRKCDVSGVAQ